MDCERGSLVVVDGADAEVGALGIDGAGDGADSAGSSGGDLFAMELDLH